MCQRTSVRTRSRSSRPEARPAIRDRFDGRQLSRFESEVCHEVVD